ncbi:MAG: hemolysin III family protein [Opitutales bacterium]|nr:hemolysin III family protein [Opitutales bacterium]
MTDKKKSFDEMHPTSGFTNLEEIFNAITHGIGFLLGIAGLVLAVVFASIRSDAWLVVACSIYGASLVILYAASTFYHAIRHLPTKKVFMILDHCGIYLLIAGTYTPFVLGPLRGPLGWSFFGVIWGIAIVGIVLESISKTHGGIRSSIIYLVMGWLIVGAIAQLYATLSTFGFVMLVVGGVCYSIGVIFYLWKNLPFGHVVWHLWVVAGSVCNFFAVFSLL